MHLSIKRMRIKMIRKSFSHHKKRPSLQTGANKLSDEIHLITKMGEEEVK